MSDGLRVPFQLQVLEADHLDSTRSGRLSNGNVINSGIEFDSTNRRVAFWMWPQHQARTLSVATSSKASVCLPTRLSMCSASSALGRYAARVPSLRQL